METKENNFLLRGDQLTAVNKELFERFQGGRDENTVRQENSDVIT